MLMVDFNMGEYFKLKDKRELPEIGAVGYLYLHEASGAKVYHLACDDENKVFCATFRTPPSDDTGVPHILEHCVLAGSKKFAAKDPFSELAKGSLYTYLNAMTYPDKTLYPIASYNDKDFLNLMEVYLDAVFFPKVYDRKESFLQEGWNLNAAGKDAPLEYNGVVYSEMKGAYSDPNSIVFEVLSEVLYPDACYRYSSGGNPEAIPDLTYDAFLDFHKKFYAPENGYLYFYGNMDINECLKMVHNDYLSKCVKTGDEIVIEAQKPFEKPVFAEKPYAVIDNDDEALNYLAAGYALEKGLPDLDYAVLYYLLMGTESSPLKKALKERGIGESVDGYASVHCVTPEISLIVQNSKFKADYFKAQVDEILSDLVKEGFDDALFGACLNYFEFYYKEQDFDRTPKGIMFLCEQFAREIYGDDPFNNFSWAKRIEELRELGTGYFIELVVKYMVENKHSAFITLVPDDKLNDNMEKEVEEKLAALKATLSEDEVVAIMKEGEELRRYQDTVDSEEVLASIPMVAISDLKKEAEKIPLEKRGDALYTAIETNGVAYINMWFDTRGIGIEELSKLNILSYLLGKMPTKKYSLDELTNEIYGKTGGIEFSPTEFDNGLSYNPFLRVQAKALNKNIAVAFDLCSEIMTNTLFDDRERVVKLITEIKAKYDNNFISAGHQTAALRALARVSDKRAYCEHIQGVSFFRYMEGLLKELEGSGTVAFEKLETELKKLAAELFTQNRLTVSVTLEGKEQANFEQNEKRFRETLPKSEYQSIYMPFNAPMENEGFITASKVQYNLIAGNFMKKGYGYDGRAALVGRILSEGYLFERIRAKGGAYGYGAVISRGGELYMFSYRDPKLRESYDVYKAAAGWLEGFSADEREMTKYILGTTNTFDKPKTARQKGVQAITDYFSGVTYEMRQIERNDILTATAGSVREFSALVRDCVEGNIICTVGSDSGINANKDLFDSIKKL